jgi:chromosome segregation ATPase
MKNQTSTMRKLVLGLSLLVFGLSFTACNNYKSEYEAILEENAAMKKQLNDAEEEGKLVRGEYSEAIETLNAIEDTLRAISDREKEIQKLTQSSEFSGNISQRQAILKKLQALKDANDQSKNQAKQMQSRLNSYRIENEQLRKMIAQAETRVLTKEQELEEAQTVIDDLRDALGKMESQLLESQGDLATAYEDLKDKNESLEETNERLNNTINELQRKTVFIEEQAKGYVACGSKRILRRKGILSRVNMKLTKEYQSAVKANSSSINYFESNEIECGTDGEIIAVLPERDESSYSIEGNQLKITDTEAFWKTDKIVVLVKK